MIAPQFQETAMQMYVRFHSLTGPLVHTLPEMTSGVDENGCRVGPGRDLLGLSDLLQERLSGQNPVDREILQQIGVVTGDVVVGSSDGGEVLFARYDNPIIGPLVQSINSTSSINSYGALVVSDDIYHAIKEEGAVALKSDEVLSFASGKFPAIKQQILYHLGGSSLENYSQQLIGKPLDTFIRESNLLFDSSPGLKLFWFPSTAGGPAGAQELSSESRYLVGKGPASYMQPDMPPTLHPSRPRPFDLSELLKDL